MQRTIKLIKYIEESENNKSEKNWVKKGRECEDV